MDKEKLTLYRDMNYFLKREYRYMKKGDYTRARIQRIYINGIKDGYSPFTVIGGINELKKEKYSELSRLLLDLKYKLENQNAVEEENKTLKLLQYKKDLLNKNFYDLTYYESKIIGKEEEWTKKARYIHRLLAKNLPVIPKGKKNYYYIYPTLKGIKKGEETLNMYIEMLYKYKGMTYDEVMDDMKKCKKIIK